MPIFELKNKETEEVVGKLTTDKDGVATSELLPIATYEEGKAYIRAHGLNMKNAVHIAWATGGSLVPEYEREKYAKTHL